MREELFGSLKISDMHGNLIGKIEDVSLEDTAPKPPYENNRKYASLNLNPSLKLELSPLEIMPLEIAPTDDILKTIGIDTNRIPAKLNMLIPWTVQARTHKKKRINKKWRKRYGFKEIMKKTKGWKIHSITDGTFKLVKEGDLFE